MGVESEARGGSGWLRNGCLGCAGLMVALLVGVSVLVSLGRQAARSQRITTRNVEEPLPAVGPEATRSSDAQAASSDAPALALPDFDPDRDLEDPDPGSDSSSRAGRVLVDLRQGEFRVAPAPPGEPLRVEAEFDENRYELVTELEQGAGGEWRYEVRFRQAGMSGLLSFMTRLMGGDDPRVVVFLPRDVPLDLDLRVTQGGGQVDLGGLWLTDAKVSFTQGGGELDFSEPLRRPTGSLRIETSMGGGSFRRLGHASPKTLRVETQMGGAEVDLRGEWRRDCEITLVSRMGGMAVRVPGDVITRGLPSDRSPAATGDEAAPATLTFSYSSSMGEIEFRN